jgi:CDGSH-type Zn-finger protein
MSHTGGRADIRVPQHRPLQRPPRCATRRRVRSYARHLGNSPSCATRIDAPDADRAGLPGIHDLGRHGILRTPWPGRAEPGRSRRRWSRWSSSLVAASSLVVLVSPAAPARPARHDAYRRIQRVSMRREDLAVSSSDPVAGSPGTAPAGTPRRRVRVVPDGPILIEGPVELTLPDGGTLCSDRFVVAVCQCRRSKLYPLCDASHRRRVRSGNPGGAGA